MTGAEFYAYIQRFGFKRTDKETEFFEACTDAVEEMRRRFGFSGDGEEKTTTDTISVDGDFKVSLESDFGLLTGIVIEDGTDATPLERKSKKQFDELYPDINVTNDRGYPKHFCVFGGNIYIGPIPDSTDYDYRITYTLKGSTVVTGTTTVPFATAYRDVLAENVLGRMYGILKRYDLRDYHWGQFEKKFAEAIHREVVNTGEHFFQQKTVDV